MTKPAPKKKISAARRLAGKYIRTPLEEFEQMEIHLIWQDMLRVCASLLGNDVAVPKPRKKAKR